MHLNRLGKIGYITYDVDRVRYNLHMQKQIASFRRHGIEIGPQMVSERLVRVMNNVNFCPSHLSTGIQLADCGRCRLAKA